MKKVTVLPWRRTIGDLGTLTMKNNNGEIVAKFYIMPDGTLHEDSWICPKGWK